MQTWYIILGALLLGAIGMVWDYFKPARFRISYRNVRKGGDGGGVSSRNDCDGDGGGDGGD